MRTRRGGKYNSPAPAVVQPNEKKATTRRSKRSKKIWSPVESSPFVARILSRFPSPRISTPSQKEQTDDVAINMTPVSMKNEGHSPTNGSPSATGVVSDEDSIPGGCDLKTPRRIRQDTRVTFAKEDFILDCTSPSGPNQDFNSPFDAVENINVMTNPSQMDDDFSDEDDASFLGNKDDKDEMKNKAGNAQIEEVQHATALLGNLSLLDDEDDTSKAEMALMTRIEAEMVARAEEAEVEENQLEEQSTNLSFQVDDEGVNREAEMARAAEIEAEMVARAEAEIRAEILEVERAQAEQAQIISMETGKAMNSVHSASNTAGRDSALKKIVQKMTKRNKPKHKRPPTFADVKGATTRKYLERMMEKMFEVFGMATPESTCKKGHPTTGWPVYVPAGILYDEICDPPRNGVWLPIPADSRDTPRLILAAHDEKQLQSIKTALTSLVQSKWQGTKDLEFIEVTTHKQFKKSMFRADRQNAKDNLSTPGKARVLQNNKQTPSFKDRDVDFYDSP